MKYAFVLFIFTLISASGHRQVVYHRGDLEYIQEGDKYIPVLDGDKKAKRKYKYLAFKPDLEKKGAQNVTTDQKSHLSTTSHDENSNQRNDADERSQEVEKERKLSGKKLKKKKNKSSRSVSEKEGKTSKPKSRKKSKKKKSKNRR
ncbi:hypothetical protein NBO_2g0075 [Nosema bombycis CQ1]|uniref:Uncharacterized protein n=1 Tax=Nosema bombycis (strain CQ1 / CVCC 102059) TaxID=578461 RepID=R0MC86_NOSB1|nr:hypothetical protein NBO_2g0075 [Nosema bombycis CQ1]|eukprot:EOB15584.1 hypothetical protein NBO_2g0075 [Nosema bombycis CQ1]